MEYEKRLGIMSDKDKAWKEKKFFIYSVREIASDGEA